ncbi:MAG: hypothetical protein ABWX92_15520 [Mycetocola sp.]
MEPIEPTAVDPPATQPIDITSLIEKHPKPVTDEDAHVQPPLQERP